METTVQAPYSAMVKAIYVKSGDNIETNDLLIELIEQFNDDEDDSRQHDRKNILTHV
nr:hypothetical protein [Alkalihalobacterium alkalinitrilicum]